MLICKAAEGEFFPVYNAYGLLKRNKKFRDDFKLSSAENDILFALIWEWNNSGRGASFQVSMGELHRQTELSVSTIRERVRQTLRDKGLIEFTEENVSTTGSGKAIEPTYQIVDFYELGERYGVNKKTMPETEETDNDSIHGGEETESNQIQQEENAVIAVNDTDAGTGGVCEVSKKQSDKEQHNAETFERFYKAYPVHKSRKAAEKAWRKLSPSDELVEVIIQHVLQRIKLDPLWQKDFIPYPATFINGSQWEDELTTKQPNRSGYPDLT